MKEKILNPGDRVKLQTRDKEWEGTILESYDSSVLLLKLSSGYNIGIREEDVFNVSVVEQFKEKTKKKSELGSKKELRNVAIVITGGTISSRLDPKTGGVISTDAEEILDIAPEIREICNIVRIEKPFIKWSENMSFGDWKILSKTVADLLNSEEIHGVIVTHGTDFLHYSASALSFFLRDLNKPVALTYSQRSIDRASTDAALNLVCAAKYAVSDIAEVALIGHKDLNDEICLAMPGTKVRKMHTSRRDAFKVVNSLPIAEISKNKFNILREFNARNDKNVRVDNNFNEDVALIQVYPGQDPDILNYYVGKGYKGIVLEVCGIGQLPAQDAKYNWLPKIKKLVDLGITICAAPQTIYGMLNQKVYSAGRDLEKTGIIFLKDILPETAFVKLAWVLGHKDWVRSKEKIKEKLLENFSNEFNERIEF
jgi:glutamyl-tRNA(Gln) amidotransferase subunit D